MLDCMVYDSFCKKNHSINILRQELLVNQYSYLFIYFILFFMTYNYRMSAKVQQVIWLGAYRS